LELSIQQLFDGFCPWIDSCLFAVLTRTVLHLSLVHGWNQPEICVASGSGEILALFELPKEISVHFRHKSPMAFSFSWNGW
jgi:hypothetical protein